MVAELEIHNPSGELSAAEYDDLSDDYYAKYRTGVEAIKKILDKPQFDDGAAVDGFPEDQDAVWLAIWRVNGIRFMLQQKNEGLDMPFRLEVVVEK